MSGISIQCCPTCGHALKSKVGEREKTHQPFEGLAVSIAYYPGGFGPYSERTRFRSEVCRKCGETLRALLEGFILKLHATELGR